MKINEIIRERRTKKGLTQEQVANALGVSAPAVNKWEKGASYPDIVLLPALARLLDTDLNTLLSFQDHLSKNEIALFMNEVADTIKESGYEAGYALADEKLKEFPTCDLLIINLALLLDGSLNLYGSKNQAEHQKQIEALYLRAAQSEDAAIKAQAQAHLISKLIEEQEYSQAQELLNTIPRKGPVDWEQTQANIYIAQGELEKAAKLTEEKLLSVTTDLHAVLMTLMELALKEGRTEDAEYIADIDQKSAQLYDLWAYNSYVAHFQLYSATKQRGKLLALLLPMLKSLTRKWELNQSPLYRHIQTKSVDPAFGASLQKTILRSIGQDEDTAFLKDSPELQTLMKDLDVQ